MARSNDRLFSLDILRGVAVSLVLFRHLPVGPSPSESVLGAIHEIGWTGVDLFFVLSGLLISGLLYDEVDRTGGIRFGRFWLRRGMKIWPAYFIIYGLHAAAAGGPAVSAAALLPNLFFIQNYAPGAVRWNHSWSLAVEEHFYLLLPLLIGFLCRFPRGLRALPKIGLAACAAILAARIWIARSPDRHWDDLYYPTHLRLDSLLFGVMLGFVCKYARHWCERIARLWPVLLPGAAVVLALVVRHPLEQGTSTMPFTIGFTLLYLAYGAIVVLAEAHPRAGQSNPIARALAWLGVYSYTIYLCHGVVMDLPGLDRLLALLRHRLVDSPWVDRVLFCCLSIAAGYLSSLAIERPFLALRARWLPMTRTSPITAQAIPASATDK